MRVTKERNVNRINLMNVVNSMNRTHSQSNQQSNHLINLYNLINLINLIHRILNRINLTHQSHMGWLRLVGSLKLHVSFAEYSLFYRSLLQKRPITLRSLLIEATRYQGLVSRRQEWETELEYYTVYIQ